MHLSDDEIQGLLVGDGRVNDEKLTELKERVINEKTDLKSLLVSENIISEQELSELYAKKLGVPFTDISIKDLNPDVLKQIPENIARLYNMVLFKGDINTPEKHIAMEDPEDLQALDVLHKLFGQNIKIYLATHFNILSAIDQYKGNITSEISKVITETSEEDDANQEVRAEEISEDSPIAQTVNLIIEYAIKNNASDIHIEPRNKYVAIRYRIDGVLKEANRLPRRTLNALVSRIKILSSLKIDERRVPQDGRFKITINGQVFAFRVSTLPITEGEKVAMRVLDESTEPSALEKLGFWGRALDNINEAIIQPHGMILVTGPTGSGKSTTLHSVLHILNKPEVNISTIEDPVEYKLEGVNQTQVNPTAGMTFAAGLRSLLRQDPNIIMVGEIRDKETAGLAVQAALTGHLVFSTLHTNNAATSLPRLLDMGIEPFLIASVVRVVIGQRLVRCLVPEETEPYEPDANEKRELERIFGIKTNEDWQKIFTHLNEAQVAMGKKVSNNLVFYRPKKDLPPEKNGYKGRMGIYEVLKNTSDIQKMIVANDTSESLQNKSIEEGMISMQIDGLVKALLGLTTIDEILRVTRE
jgi:type IV pilus assembly protein PilB